MPIDHPSDLPDDADRAGEWRAAEDSQAPGGRRPNPAEQAAEQPPPSAGARPDDRSQASSDAPAADSERLSPGDQQGDNERRAPGTQPVDQARPDTSTAAAEAPDPPEAATSEPRTRQEHADTGPPQRIAEIEAPTHSVDESSTESQGDRGQFQDPPTTEQQSDPRQIADDPPSPDGLEGNKRDPRSANDGAESPANQPRLSSHEADLETDTEQVVNAGPQEGDSTSQSFNRDPTLDTNPSDGTDKDGDSTDRQPSSANDATTDGLIGPVTDTEWTEHIVEVIDDLAKARAAGLRTDRLHTVDNGREIWTEERELLHDSIIQDLYSKAAEIPCEHRAIIAGGLGGAGKTTILTEYAGIDLSRYLMINPDSIKEEMARRGMIPEVGRLSPMEASDLAHEESSYLAQQLALRAQADGKNLIWDITMSTEKSTSRRIQHLREGNYSQIDGIFVDIPTEASIKRTEARHREGHNEWLAGRGLGGRYVPPEVIRGQNDNEWGSQNRRTFESMKDRLDSWALYDNSVDGRPPSLVNSSQHREHI